MYVFLFLKKNPKYIGMEIVAGVYSLRNLDDGMIAVNGKDKIVFNNVFLYDFENKITSFLIIFLMKIFYQVLINTIAIIVITIQFSK